MPGRTSFGIAFSFTQNSGVHKIKYNYNKFDIDYTVRIICGEIVFR